MGDGDRTAISVDESSALGKEDGEKGSGGVGLSEKKGYARPFCCKPICEVVQAQRSSGLECEGPVIFSSSRLGWALKEREICGPKVCWEEGQPSRGVEWASCGGPANIQWDGLGCVANRPKSGLKEGQPSVGANWASNPHRPILDNPLKEARASFCQLRSEGWFAEELLASGMSSEVEKGATGRCSLADVCLLEEVSRYSLFEPSFVCIWGGRVSSSSPFSGVEGALIEEKKSRGMDAFLRENKGELIVSPLRVCLTEVRLSEKVVGESFLLKEGRDERVEKVGEDEE